MYLEVMFSKETYLYKHLKNILIGQLHVGLPTWLCQCLLSIHDGLIFNGTNNFFCGSMYSHTRVKYCMDTII